MRACLVRDMGVGEATQDIALGFGSVWVTASDYLSRIGSIWVGNATRLIRITPG